MKLDPAQVRAVFLEAVEKRPPDTWDQFLAEACGDNGELRRQVANLLSAHRLAGDFLAEGAVAAPRMADQPPVQEAAGTVIGPYKLLEQINEGGFGVVFMAEQTEPVRRKVALKILKAGMDTRQVVARFEAERQALAIMDHPNIAQVFDGGATASGRPYFVMELVKGVPITQYCDEHRLTPRQRLELFVPVCHAIQHAHQKGIIHRDLKPSNVLVARYDDKPVPKVIDFGVAKAIGQQLTEQTLHTGFRSVVGTLEYMSPEQANFNQLDIDTRSDVYSLAILLYELLTGTTPLEHKTAKEAGLLEALRIIREVEAPTLSKRLSTAEELASIAARRALEPAKLTKLMSGELDWIVMKALEKDRNRRYETANAFAADVQRYLSDEPVQACPPSAGYRLRKFARRNKRAVLAVTAIFVLLIAGIGGTTWGLVRAENALWAEAEQRQLAEAAAKSERAAREAEAEQRHRATEEARKATHEAATAAAIVDFLNNDILRLSSPVGQAQRGVTPDAHLSLRAVLQRAAQRIDGKFANAPEVEMRLRYTIGYALSGVGDRAGALSHLEKAAPLYREILGRDHAETLKVEFRLAGLHRHLGRFDIALPLLEENLERHKTALGEGHPQTFLAMNGLAMAYSAAGQGDKAVPLAEQTLELRKRRLGPTHGETLISMNNLALLYHRAMRPDKAVPLFEEALAGCRAKYPPLHPERMNTTRNLAHAYHAAEQIDRALPLQELATGQYRTVYGLEHSTTQGCIDSLIAYSVDAGSCDKAAALLKSIRTGDDNGTPAAKQRQQQRERRYRNLVGRVRPAAEKYQQALAAKTAEHADTLAARQAFAVVLREQKRYNASAYHLTAILDARGPLSPGDHRGADTCRLELGTVRVQQRKYAEAEPLLLEAYAGLEQHDTTTGESGGALADALQRLVELYDAWGKKDKADVWRKKLDEKKDQ